MTELSGVLKNDERVMLALRKLYSRHGYRQYKMNKFEEYDFYAENKSFLLSENIITFSDLDGRLMALKPDVTLSIVKNAGEISGLQKLYYNENVYRAGREDRRYREIMQTGLECIGELDDYCVGEVTALAWRSLREIGPDFILDLSHLGYLRSLLEYAGLQPEQCSTLLKYIRDKNSAAAESWCLRHGVSGENSRRLVSLSGAYGPFPEMFPLLRELSCCPGMLTALEELEGLYSFLTACGCEQRVNVDLSIVSDLNYYNGVIFQGFVEGVPSAVLSGGRYDNLLQKFGRKAGAIGFAVYLDRLERLHGENPGLDADVLLLYGDRDRPHDVAAAVHKLTEAGKSVLARRGDAPGLRCGEVLRLTDKGVEAVEENA